jgi:hypothetical protein
VRQQREVIKVKGSLMGYFTDAPEVSSGKRLLLILLGVLLFLSLIVFGPILALQQTVFNPGCIASYADDIDVPALANDWLKENVAPKNPVLAKSMGLLIINYEPQIKAQLRSCVRDTYAFMLDRLEKGKLLETVAAQRPTVDNMASNIQAVLDLPGLAPAFKALGVTPDSILKYVDVKQINGYFDMLEQLAALRNIVVTLDIVFIPLIIFSLALIIAIKLIARRPKFISGELGLVFAISGALQFLITLPLSSIGRSAISQFNLPSLVQTWLLRMVGDYTNIVMIYGGVLLLCGIALIVLYYVLKSRAAGLKAA